MPIRNFYIDCEIDGWKSKLAGGPAAKDGGFNLIIYQRSGGKKIKALEVTGIARDNGILALDILTCSGFIPITYHQNKRVTKR